MRWAKLIVGLLLLPFCIGGAKAVCHIVAQSGEAVTFWVAAGSGAACWLVIFLMLPKPMWVYVLGHELTHALWTWLFGGKVMQIKASAKGGRTVVTKSNFLISLAPYFFPFYAVVVILAYLTGDLVWNWTSYLVWFHFALGVAYAFHLTLTWEALRTVQTDITQHGIVFSLVTIWLGNLAVLVIGLPLLAERPSLPTALTWWWQATVEIVNWLCRRLTS